MKRGEHELTWLGTTRFWGFFGAIFVVGLLLFFYRREAVSRPSAVVPVVSLTGPERLVAGGTARYAVLVRDRYGAPLPDADVRVGFWRAGMTELGRGRSSASGDATIEVKVPDDFNESRSLVAIAEAGVAEGRAHLMVMPDSPGQGSTFISTDKPIYQPGQTVHLRALTMAGETPIAERPSTVEIRTPDGIKVFYADKPTSAFGVVAHDFPLAEQVKLGTYVISFSTTTADGHSVSGSRTFEVKRYSLPKLKVALEELPEVLADGAALRGVARARWIFGEPVTKGAMTVSVDGGPRIKGPLNKDGELRFELFAPKGNSSFTVHAKLEVEGGITAEATHAVTRVTNDQIRLEAFPESGVLAPDVAQDVYVVVTHPDPSSVVVKMKGVAGSEVKTSARGIAVVRVSPPRGRVVTLEATGPGGAQGRLDLSTTLDRLVVRPDHTEYAAGQPIKLSVLGAEPGDRVALRVTKGTEPIAIGMCTVAGNGCDATLAMPAKTSGLVWVHAMSLPGGHREVRAGKRMIVVQGGARDLDLKVTPDKAAYAPREQGHVDVAVTAMGAGVPTKAQLGVAIADEAVFALGDVRPDLEKKFFTTEKDLASARRGGYWYPYWYSGSSSSSTPGAGPHEATKVYDATTPEDVRGAVLAALTSMPEPGGFEDATSSTVSQKADAAVETRKNEIAGSMILFVAFMTMVLFGCFAAYAIVRWRSPLLIFEGDAASDAATKLPLMRETRALMFDWLAGILAPPVFLFAAMVFGEVLVGSAHPGDAAVAGFWIAIALFAAIALVRTIVRVRRMPLLDDAPVLKRALLLLPLASFLGHLVIVLVLLDRGRKLEHAFPVRQDAALLALAIVTLAQITFGFLSVVRQGLLRPLAKKTKAWLFLSRASFIGLPLSLAAIVAFAWTHSREQRSSSWTDGDIFEKAYSPGGAPAAMEGGSGTRAKGEEGSMGNPLAALGKASAPSADAVAADETKKAAGNDGKPVAVVRDYFPETLLWAPEIITDDAGHAKVTVPFADSITTWRFAVRAVSKAGQLGSATLPLVVKQDFFVEASLPPLLTQGDEIAVPVTVYGYTDDAQDVSIDVEGDGIATVGPANFSLRLGKNETRGMRFVVRADKAGDRVVRIKASSRTRADVVERKVKIVPNGLEMVRPLNGRLQGGATVRTDFPAGAIDGGNDLFVKIYGGPLSQVAEGLDGVFAMPHGCFEQTSSVTYPSILALDFLVRSKAVSPEVERKARAYIADGYQRLVSFQVEGGGFSAFGRSPASPMLTAYGLMELADMSRVAVVDESLVSRTREWLYTKHTQTGGYKKNDLDTADSPMATAYVAWALASFGTEKQPQTEPRLAALLDYVEKTNLRGADDAYGLALRANALLAGGRGDRAKLLLDKLASLAIRTEEGVHWSSSESGVLYSYGSSLEIETTGLAAHALARAGRDAELRAGALDWLVARKSSYGTWSTTQSTIAAMRALLDEAKPAPKGPQLITVTVDGEKLESYDMQPNARDVHHHVDLRRFAGTGAHAVEVRATGEGDVSYQLVSTHWIPWERPKPASLALDVNYGASNVPVGGTTRVHARVSWNGKEPATMPLVEIAIPPAFEAEPSDLDALVAANKEVARWTLEHGTVTLYLTSLTQDKPVDVTFALRALRPAKVVASASTAYLYYRPEVRTETAPVLLTSR